MNESKNVSTECVNFDSKGDSWDKAVSDAEEEILRLSRQMQRLRQAQRIFRANKKEGVPWPVSSNQIAYLERQLGDLS
jgi:hypothetical protein